MQLMKKMMMIQLVILSKEVSMIGLRQAHPIEAEGIEEAEIETESEI